MEIQEFRLLLQILIDLKTNVNAFFVYIATEELLTTKNELKQKPWNYKRTGIYKKITYQKRTIKG